MSEETVTIGSPSKRKWKWFLRGTIGIFAVLVFSLLGHHIVLVETPVHFVFGWLFHMVREAPPLWANWRAILPPLGSLALGSWLIHRFAGWLLAANGKPGSWRPRQTLMTVALFLLGCAAAIAMSGIVHQLVWLLKDPWLEDRSRKSNLVTTMSNARQLLLAIHEHHDSEGSYPDSLNGLELLGDRPNRILWVNTGNGGVKEPFVLLHPGTKRILDADEPLIASPVIQGDGGRVVVGYADSSVRSANLQQFAKILQDRAAEQPHFIPADE